MSMGTPTSNPALTMSKKDNSLRRESAKYLATASIRMSLTHSEGWKCCPPGNLKLGTRNFETYETLKRHFVTAATPKARTALREDEATSPGAALARRKAVRGTST